jgi:hypothetical protein
MNDDTQRTAQNPSGTVGAGGGRNAQTNRDALNELGDRMRPDGSVDKPRADESGPYDDDGALAQQTPGLDPAQLRRDAGPDWPAGEKGDVEADTSPPGGSGAGSSEPGSSTR